MQNVLGHQLPQYCQWQQVTTTAWTAYSHYIHTIAKEITYAAAESVREYIWRVKWDQGKRNKRLGRLNSHPSNRESCLTSGLPKRCKLPHCAIDLDVAFWYHYLSPARMHWDKGILSLGDAWRETSLDVGLLKKIVAGKKEFIGRS